MLESLIRPPLERRRDEWIESLAKELEELERRIDGLSIEALSRNEEFVTTLIHATRVAIASHQREKLEALRNAVLNASLPNSPNEDLQIWFLSLIDAFTVSHLTILAFLVDPKGFTKKAGIGEPNWHKESMEEILARALPDWGTRAQFYLHILKEMYNRGLIRYGELKWRWGGGTEPSSSLTPLGEEFFRFISKPPGLSDD